MENSNPYDETLKWYPDPTYYSGMRPAPAAYGQQTQPYEYIPYVVDSTPHWSQSAQAEKLQPRQASRKQARMSKAEALSLASKLKKTALVASITLFGVISGLVVTHLQGTSAASQTTSSSSSPGISSPSNSSNPSNVSNPSDSSNSGGFFGQQGGGYGFGNGGSTTSPSTGSHVS